MYLRTLYEIADANHTTVGELTGTRRKYSTIQLPERVAQAFGLSEDESQLVIEHYDEGISSNEIPFIMALWEIKKKESKEKNR